MAHLANMAVFFDKVEKASEDEYGSIYDAFMNEDFDNVWLPVCVTAKHIETYGGEEQGSEYWTVIEFKEEYGQTVYVKFNGYYASFHGADYESWKVVTAKEKVIKVWD